MLESIHLDVTTYLSGSPKKLIIGGAQVLRFREKPSQLTTLPTAPPWWM